MDWVVLRMEMDHLPYRLQPEDLHQQQAALLASYECTTDLAQPIFSLHGNHTVFLFPTEEQIFFWTTLTNSKSRFSIMGYLGFKDETILSLISFSVSEGVKVIIIPLLIT